MLQGGMLTTFLPQTPKYKYVCIAVQKYMHNWQILNLDEKQ